MEETAPGRLVPVHRGIELEAIPLTGLPPGATLWFSSSHWCTDLGQKRVVRDVLSKQIMEWCVDQFELMIQRWPVGNSQGEALELLEEAVKGLERDRARAKGLSFPNLSD
jgi:diketogulonate reductase-like aldo/keto reductase